MRNFSFSIVISNSICDGYVDEKLDDFERLSARVCKEARKRARQAAEG